MCRLSVFAAALPLAAMSAFAAVSVDANLPAGNIVFERMEGDSVYVHQDLRDTPKPWFYWAMRVTGAAGRTLTFNFTASPAVGLHGPCVSLDRGVTFSYAAEGGATRNSFTYSFPPGVDEVWFYANEPYGLKDWQGFLDAHRAVAGRWFVADTLTKSRKGRDVPRARFGCISKAPRYRVFACSRHHCAETMGSFVVEGMAAAFLADDDLGRWLRENVELLAVPFVDLDGAVDGDQGKNRAPHDHNRDYVDFIYPETKAIAEWLADKKTGRIDAFFDIHCPTYMNRHGYSPRFSANLVREMNAEARFSELLEKLQCGKMRYRASDDLMPGQGHNKGDRIARSSAWASRNLPDVRLVRVVEVPFAESNGTTVDGGVCRAFGGDMARTIRAFFQDDGDGAPKATCRLEFGKGRKVVTLPVHGVRAGDGIWRFTVPKENMPADGTLLSFSCDWASAQKGEAGWWLCGRGARGYFTRDEFSGGEGYPWTQHPYFAMKTPRATFIAVFDGMRYDVSVSITARDGRYKAFATYRIGASNPPSMRENVTMTVYSLPADADYNDMAKIYRRHRVALDPSIRPMKERMKDSPHLARLAKCMPVRQWHAMKKWLTKDVKVMDFTPETEPPVQCVQSFATSLDTLRKFKAAGIDDLYFCVSGWQTGGYDGRCPATFPVCSEAGGEDELRKLIAGGQALGYIVDAHSNFTDCYPVSPMWDGGAIACKGPKGELEKNGVWCGGQAYNLCLKNAWEKFIPGDLERIAALGFRGCHYVDVFTCAFPYRCFDPNHPASAAEQRQYELKVIDKCRSLFGGCASECAMDDLIGHVDYINYVSNWERQREERLRDGRPTREDDFVPFFELAFHDVTLSTRDRLTQRFADRIGQLKNIEFGSRPFFYHLLPSKLPEMKEVYNEFLKYRHLLVEEMVRHEKLADGVFRTRYANGEFTVVNYNDEIYAGKGIRIAPKGWKLFTAKGEVKAVGWKPSGAGKGATDAQKAQANHPSGLPSLKQCRAPVERAKEHVKGLLLLEAEGFADYGKWRLDTQFVHKMGSAFLIAAGVGNPVESASTKVEIPRAGRWTVWTRCNDWRPPHSPGRFAVLVGGREGKVLGASGVKGWRWERSGALDLAAGEIEVKLVDKAGYFARCDAVLLSEDGGYVPPDGEGELERLRLRLKGQAAEPEDGGEYDVVVVGAGTTGMGAAVAAAHTGARTALVHDRPGLGGNASAELGVAMHGAAHSHPNSRETGFVEEAKLIRSRMSKDGGKASISAAYLEQARGERRLKVFMNQRVVKVEKSAKGHIAAVTAVDTLTGSRTRYRAKVFIDTTGDGWIGYYAGVPYRYGREGQSEFGEAEAPEKPDGTTMSGVIITDGTWCFGYRDTGREVAYRTPEWAKDSLPEGWTRKYPPKLRVRGGFGPSWKVEHPGDVDDFTDPEGARDELVRLSFAYFGWGKNEWEHRDLLKNYALSWVPYIDARRETLRLMGDYILTGNDQKAATVFPDRIAYGGWPMDTHDPLGFANPSGNGYWKNHPSLPIYTIPYRILYNPGFDNLLFAGRCSSVSHMGLGSVRLESTLATLGQVCGTAAALCVKYGETPKEIGQRRLKELQQRLLRDDMYIPGVKNEDSRDIARRTTVTATSSQERMYFRESPSVKWSIATFGIGFRNKKDESRPGWLYAEGAHPAAVIDGVNRIVGNEAHGWVSDSSAALPQSITLEWPKPVTARHVRITFNSDLMPAQPAAMPTQLVKSYAVEVRSGGRWEEVAAETGNWRRLATHHFERREIDALRVVCRETWGDPSAQIFEVRVY